MSQCSSKKKVVGENPRCAGGVHAIRFDELGIRLTDNVGLAAKIRRVRIYSPNRNYWELDSRSLEVAHMGYVFHRDKFGAYLAERAQKLGAKIKTGVHVYRVNVIPPSGLRGLLATDSDIVPFDICMHAPVPM